MGESTFSYAIPALLDLPAAEFRAFLKSHEIRADHAYMLPEQHNINVPHHESFRRVTALCIIALESNETFDAFRLDHVALNRVFVSTLTTAFARWRDPEIADAFTFTASTLDLLTQSLNMAAEFIYLSISYSEDETSVPPI
jgi:hypothetical protein